ncbi:MAG: hypothetical protein AAB731_02380 [Patescibacteria group bacterium]
MKRAKSIFLWCGDPPAGGERRRGGASVPLEKSSRIFKQTHHQKSPLLGRFLMVELFDEIRTWKDFIFLLLETS